MKKLALVLTMGGALMFGALGLSASAASAEDHIPLTQAKECPSGHVWHPFQGCIPISPGPDSAR